MNHQANKVIFRKSNAKGFQPKYVAEVGVYLPETSNIVDYIKNGVKAILVEPDLKTIEKIKQYFGKEANMTLHAVAIYDYNGTLTLVQRNASTFVSDLKASPALVNDKYTLAEEDKFEVPCATFDTIDDGTIDLLSVDIEGSEWYVIKNLKSRPKVLSIETHGKSYVNPFLIEILAWIEKENYQVWYKDKSDTVFVKKGTFPISFSEKLQLIWINFYINFRRFRKKIKFS